MPIEVTLVVVPGLLKMPTGVGTLEIEAGRLERAAVKPAAPVAPTAPQTEK